VRELDKGFITLIILGADNAGQPMGVLEEALYMQLLAAEHSGEEPDDGELEGSGDDYYG
jgi:hypothetical protein